MVEKPERYWNQFSFEETESAIADSAGFIIMWMEKNGIRCGSCNGYNIYRAVQDALRDEWKKNRNGE